MEDVEGGRAVARTNACKFSEEEGKTKRARKSAGPSFGTSFFVFVCVVGFLFVTALMFLHDRLFVVLSSLSTP